MAQTINLNIIPKGIPDVVNVSQFDIGRTLQFNLYEGAQIYTIPAGATAVIGGKKGDANIFTYDATISEDRHTVTAITTEQMTAIAGENLCQLRLNSVDAEIATINFRMFVQERPDVGDIESESEIPAIIELARQQQYNAEAWAEGTKNGVPVTSSDPQYHNHAKYWADDARQTAIGGIKYRGSILFANIPLTGMDNGDMYNITDAFTTDNRFVEGPGKQCVPGTNIIWNGTENLWDLAGGAGVTITPYNNTPEMDTTNGSAGTSTSYARGDHSHPSDTSKINNDAGFAHTDDITYNPDTKTVTCSKSVSNWASQIYSKSGYVDNVFVTFKPFDRNGYHMMGLDSNPSESVDFTSIDFCFFCQGGGSLYIFESGTQITLPAGHTTYIGGDELRIEYSGGYVRYYHNGVLVRSVARAIGNPLYLDSSFYNSGSVYDVEFGAGLGRDFVDISDSFVSDSAITPIYAYKYKNLVHLAFSLGGISMSGAYVKSVLSKNRPVGYVAASVCTGANNIPLASGYLDASGNIVLRTGGVSVTGGGYFVTATYITA